jgi:predicted tellurium resistance membrane protein TerC
MNFDPNDLAFALLFLIALIGLFLLLRGVMLWYWGISRIHSQNEKIIKLLKQIAPQPEKDKSEENNS